MKVLFIDDQKEILELLEESLHGGSVQMTFRESHDYIDAMTAIKSENPDLLFLDHSLSRGGDEGFEIVEELRKSGNTMRIVSTTSGSAMEVYQTLFGIDHVEKFDIKKIKKVIAAYAAADSH